METKRLHISQVPVVSGLPKSFVDPIKPELFAGKHEAQLGKHVGMTQFGVNNCELRKSMTLAGHDESFGAGHSMPPRDRTVTFDVMHLRNSQDVTLDPGAASALRHWHEAEDEFVYVLHGTLVLIDDNGEHELTAGSFAGFPAGVANAHHLRNDSNLPATYIAVGSRKPGQEIVHYPDDPIGPIRK